MGRMSLAGMLALAVPVLALHLVAIALTKALQSYSRTLLEERCARRGRSTRALAVEHCDRKTERAAEALAVVTGFLLAALLGVCVGRASWPPRVDVLVLVVLVIGVVGYVIAGVIGTVFAEAVVDALWPAAALFRAAASPLTLGLLQVERLVESLAGRSKSARRPRRLCVEVPGENDVQGDDTEPKLPETARAILQHVVALTRTTVGELLTPRSSIVSLPSTVAVVDAAATFRRTGFSRIPIFGESRDDVVGILYAKDLFARMTEGRSLPPRGTSDLVRPAIFVPESKNAFDLLAELRDQRRHVALVLDEYGSLAGLITLEDLFEQLVGRIDDEHDIPATADPVRELGSARYEVDATLALEDLNLRLGLHLPTNAEYHSVGGLVFHELGRVPQRGDSVIACGVAFTVVEVRDQAIRRLVLELSWKSNPVEVATAL